MPPDEVDVMYEDQELTMSKFLKRNQEPLQNEERPSLEPDSLKDENVIKLGPNRIFSFQNEEQQFLNGLALTQ